jgi:crossover junction endodeoxyribonuclease RuvC
VFERVVLGIDPGTAATGVAVIAGGNGAPPRVAAAATIRTPAGSPEAERLLTLHRAITALLTDHHPEATAVERLMWGKNVGSAMSVARASGVALLASAELGVPIHEYAPLEVKMAVTGDGGASKQQVRRALQRLHRIDAVPDEPDAADAVAVALCHLHQSRALRGAAR